MRSSSYLLVAGLAVSFLACGSEEPSNSEAAGGSGGSSVGGATGSNGGTVVTGGSGAKGGSNSVVASGGSTVVAGTSAVSCPAVPARCTPKALAGDMVVDADNPATVLQGVTEIDGNLDIKILGGLDALDCLETVTGDVTFEPSGAGDAPVLRNLRTVNGSVDFRSLSSTDINLDCALASLQTVKGLYAGVRITSAFSGELNLANLAACNVVELKNTDLSRLVLPSGIALAFYRLTLEGNETLSEVSGFQDLQLSPLSGNALYLEVMDNPLLSTCRALELKALFEAAGTTISGVTGNASDC